MYRSRRVQKGASDADDRSSLNQSDINAQDFPFLKDVSAGKKAIILNTITSKELTVSQKDGVVRAVLDEQSYKMYLEFQKHEVERQAADSLLLQFLEVIPQENAYVFKEMIKNGNIEMAKHIMSDMPDYCEAYRKWERSRLVQPIDKSSSLEPAQSNVNRRTNVHEPVVRSTYKDAAVRNIKSHGSNKYSSKEIEVAQSSPVQERAEDVMDVDSDLLSGWVNLKEPSSQEVASRGSQVNSQASPLKKSKDLLSFGSSFSLNEPDVAKRTMGRDARSSDCGTSTSEILKPVHVKPTGNAAEVVDHHRCSNAEFDSFDKGRSDRYDPNSNMSRFSKFPSTMNILVLGETGVGKSTFINGLVNYLKYESMDDALGKGVEILIKSHFALTDDNYKSHDIVTDTTVVEERRGKSNENTISGQSATQDPKSYVFCWGPEGEEKSIRIIDTPGIGDTRGIDQDKKNFEKILGYIADFSELHAVCILIKPNTSRLTLAFRFCIDELLVHLHKSASDNILFCFTNTRGTLYKPGDTLPTLREHLANLERKRGIRIPLDKSTLFSFDNESFRFLCACKEGFPFSDIDRSNFDASWSKSVEETLRLFDRITELPVHSVQDTLSLNNTRSLILTLTRPLGEIAKSQVLNMQLIEDKLNEVENNAAEGKNLEGLLFVEQVVLQSIELEKPQTVCTSGSCVEYKRLGESEVVNTIYTTVCHEDCALTGVQVEQFPNSELQNCSAMINGSCTKCKCRWELHMHIRYRVEELLKQVTDPDVEASIRNKDGKNKTLRIFIAGQEKKMEELRKEHDFITECCAEFAAFLSANSIMPYNDSYGQYIEHLIREEQEKVDIGGGSRLLEELTDMKFHYNEQVTMLKNSIGAKARCVKSVEEIDEMISQLSNLKHCGSTIDEIKNIRLHTVNKNAVEQGHKIKLGEQGSNLLDGAKNLMKKGFQYFSG